MINRVDGAVACADVRIDDLRTIHVRPAPPGIDMDVAALEGFLGALLEQSSGGLVTGDDVVEELVLEGVYVAQPPTSMNQSRAVLKACGEAGLVIRRGRCFPTPRWTRMSFKHAPAGKWSRPHRAT